MNDRNVLVLAEFLKLKIKYYKYCINNTKTTLWHKIEAGIQSETVFINLF